MSNPGEEYCRRDRSIYRQNHKIAGAASATDRYHIPPYESSSNARHLSVYEPFAESSRRAPSQASYDSVDCHERHTLSTPYELSDKYCLPSGYELTADHRLPPLPPSPSHYVLDCEEPFIPPPDCYLSPPAPAPPDRLQSSAATSQDHFLLSSSDLYLPSAPSVDKYRASNGDRLHDRYTTDKYSTCSSPENQLDRHPDRYGGASYAAGPGDPYVRQDLGYHNHYRLLNSNYYHQKPNYSLQRHNMSSSVRPALHNQYQTLRIQKCCSTARDPPPGAQQRIRSSRTSSPISVMSPSAAATIPVDFNGASSNGGRYLTSYASSTLPRCNSYGDVQCYPSSIGTFRRTPLAPENCFKRRTSSPSATCSYPSHSSNYQTTATTTSASSSSVSSISSQSFHQPSLPQLSSTWKSVSTNATNSGSILQSGGSQPSSGQIASNANVNGSNNNNNSSSNVNSPSLSFSSSRSSPSLTIISATNTTASATTSPTAISTNSGSSSAVMDNHPQQVQWSGVARSTAEIEETGSPATEVVEDSLSSTSESLSSPPHQTTAVTPLPMPSSRHRNPPASLPVQSTFDRPIVKHPLQHQISVPVTATEVASSRRYSRSISKKELIKNYIKKETAVFFGVHEPTEENERARWLDRTKRLACRTYGKLKNEYQLSSACSTLQKPDVLPLSSQKPRSTTTPTDERDGIEPRSIESTLKRKPSVAKMTFDGVAYVVSTLGKHKRRPSSTSRQWSRSYAPSSVPPTPSSPLDDEVFFDGSPQVEEYPQRSFGSTAPLSSTPYQPSTPTAPDADQIDHSDIHAQHAYIRSAQQQRRRKEKYYAWRRPKERVEEESGQVGLSRIWGNILDRVLDNSDRRQYGMGIVGKLFGRSLKRSVINRGTVKEQLEDLEDHRPFFTYWVTTVQILILALSIFAYGLGPIGFNLTQKSGLVLVTSLSLQQVEYSEPSNFWIGPRAADLIHMGAKFAPCMRKDKKIIKEIEKLRDRERDTACCIRNDDSGCVQTSQAECSQIISRWKKWSGKSGSVCGLDPKFCEAPASVAPYEWPDDITKWPICRKMNSRFPVQTPFDQQRFQKDKMTAEHMVCEVIGHPCCIGIHGTCRITTKEYCDFVRGYFHEEASLCSQVSCLDDVCGMIPFYFPEVPDQFYRLWTSLFIHAGVVHLAVTIIIQYVFMRDLEKLTGSLRIGFIYIGSGMAGNLASAIFVPYRADVGPAGAQFGLLACLIVEVLNCWPMLKHPFKALFRLLGVTSSLFLVGLLPWVDNFAHLFGFIFGFLLSYALLPFVSFGQYDRQKKIFLIWVCLLSSLFLFILLVLLFYLIPIYDCEFCQYFNCIPLTRDFCASQNINFKREEFIV